MPPDCSAAREQMDTLGLRYAIQQHTRTHTRVSQHEDHMDQMLGKLLNAGGKRHAAWGSVAGSSSTARRNCHSLAGLLAASSTPVLPRPRPGSSSAAGARTSRTGQRKESATGRRKQGGKRHAAWGSATAQTRQPHDESKDSKQLCMPSVLQAQPQSYGGTPSTRHPCSGILAAPLTERSQEDRILQAPDWRHERHKDN
jgi:hypothetical protein